VECESSLSLPARATQQQLPENTSRDNYGWLAKHSESKLSHSTAAAPPDVSAGRKAI
jgi:hypothetical protein